MARPIKLGVGTGGLALEQWRSLEERVADVAYESEILGLEGTIDHSEVLLDRLMRGGQDGAVLPTRFLPTPLPPGIEIVAVAPRRTPLSAFLSYDGIIVDEFEAGAVIGVGGPLEAAQMIHYRPEFRVVVVPGNVRMQLSLLENEEIDALVAPAAFTEWLGIQDLVSEILGSDIMVPLTGQGSLSLIGREGESVLAPLGEALDDPMAHREVDWERDIVMRVSESRYTLATALARQHGDEIEIDATVVDLGGRRRHSESMSGSRDDVESMINEISERLTYLRDRETV